MTTKTRVPAKKKATPDVISTLPKRGPGRPRKVQPVKSAAQIVSEIDQEIARLEELKKLAEILR